MAKYKAVRYYHYPHGYQVKKKVWWGWKQVLLVRTLDQILDWAEKHLSIPDKDQMVTDKHGSYIHNN